MTDPLHDDALCRWRDALAGGRLPQPSRDRWQPLRAGVVDLWEFEAVEYWYAGGWAQLMGRNETGKSSLMALTTLIPWLGDTSSDKIDTLGRSGKQFAYYVRPSGEGDRREQDTGLHHGWLWVEYGRVVDGEPRYFTTLLHAAARTGTSTTRLTWCTSDDSRVRGALRLAEGRAVRPPKDIDAAGFVAHPSAAAYRQALADRLLGGSVTHLDSIGKLLKVTRQPKLGAQLKVDFVTHHLREALPELDRSEVDELAQGWDQLDQLATDLDRSREATAQVAAFEQHAWRPWASALLRLRADDVAARQTAFDAVTRDERAARAELARSEEDERALEQDHDRVHTRLDTTRARADELRASTRFREAQERLARAEQKERDAQAARDRLERSSRAHEAARERADRAQQAHAAAITERDRTATAVRDADDRVRDAARPTGIEVDLPVDVALVEQQVAARLADVRRVAALVTAAEGRRAQATLAEAQAGEAQQAADNARSRADESWDAAERELAAVIDALAAWAPADAADLVPAWVAALPRTVDLDGSPRLVDLVRSGYLEPRRSVVQDRRHRASARLDRLRQETARTEAELDEVLTARVESPPPPLWRRRDRDDAAGAPFWRLVDPVGSVPDDELAELEAALAASGILDAWATAHDRDDSLDTFLDPGSDALGAGRRLSDVLTVVPGAGEVEGVVRRVLDHVTLCAAGEPLPPQGTVVALDGRWRTPTLSGQAASRHGAAEWLGEPARERRRQRRAAELQAALAALRAEAGGLDEEIATCDTALGDLQRLQADAPDDDALRRALTTHADRVDAAEHSEHVASDRHEQARGLRVAADSADAELRRAAAQLSLPTTAALLADVRDAVHGIRSGLVACRHSRAQATAATARADETGAAAESLAAEAERTAGQQDQDRRSHDVARSAADAVRAAIEADDSVLLTELQHLERGIRAAQDELDRLARERLQVSGRCGAARQRLSDVVERRDEATAVRGRAQAALRQLLDRHLAADLGLELPEASSSAVEHVRAQAAELRRTLRPRRWSDSSHPDDVERNTALVQTLRRALDAKARDARAELERSGRSLRVEPDEPLVRVDVVVDSHGTTLPLGAAGAHLREVCATLESQYGDSVREVLDRLLGSTFLDHLRARMGQAAQLVEDINAVLRDHPTGTDRTTLRIVIAPGTNAAVIDAVTGARLSDPTVAEQVRDFLRTKVDEAKRAAADTGQADWRDTLADHLDYRGWYDIVLEHRVADRRWAPLTTRRYAELSGGARAVMLMLPLVAALAAQYARLPSAPRPLWLDEAFDGLDATNRSMVMRLLQRFDLDVLLAGPGRLVTVDAVPAAAIYQVVRAPAPEPGADLTAELWAGNTLQAIDLPLSWLDPEEPSQPTTPGRDTLL